MSRALLVLTSQFDRMKARGWIDRLPPGTRVEFKKPQRSLDQNALMWKRLTELAEQLVWKGQRYSPDDWKDYLMHALRRARWMPDEDGGMVPIGLRTSDLSKEEMGELLDLMDAFAARHGVVWSEPKQEERAFQSSASVADGSEATKNGQLRNTHHLILEDS